MSQIIFTDEFIGDFERLHMFLNEKNPFAAQKLAGLLEQKLDLLATIPRAFPFFGEFRLYLLEFGSSGYVILYDYQENSDTVVLLRMNHQKESGFTEA
ncbi:MAG: type II toxin-antitoxin system RelE/ParE family toxin [Burkholderiales bacterium]